ncbi:MAG TPA: tetratricopeptide repeat protein [Ignavibacteriaceae bacterium]|nr:tetratricopeptide repeat protein [Ignavibacteriaceae bacterium]
MSKSPAEIFSEKVSLIFEYNKKTPLFVRMSNTEIENNNVDKAIEILRDGIKTYPQYAAAHLLLGKAYSLIGNYTQALSSIKTGSDLIHSQKTYDYYSREIESIRKQRSLFESNAKSAFLLIEDEEKEANQPDLFIEKEEKKERRAIPIPVEDRLDQLAREISFAKLPEALESSPNLEYRAEDFSGTSMIVSETLAKIFIAQGELKEAIEVYKKLIKKNPHNIESYLKKIEDLNKELNS